MSDFSPPPQNQPYAPPQAGYYENRGPQPMKQSGLGIASFIIAMVAGISMLVLFVVAGVIEVNSPGGMDENSTEAAMIGLSLFAIGGAHLVGFALGLAGVFHSNRKKLFAILGLILNSLVILGTLGLIVLGLAMNA